MQRWPEVNWGDVTRQPDFDWHKSHDFRLFVLDDHQHISDSIYKFRIAIFMSDHTRKRQPWLGISCFNFTRSIVSWQFKRNQPFYCTSIFFTWLCQGRSQAIEVRKWESRRLACACSAEFCCSVLFSQGPETFSWKCILKCIDCGLFENLTTSLRLVTGGSNPLYTRPTHFIAYLLQ